MTGASPLTAMLSGGAPPTPPGGAGNMLLSALGGQSGSPGANPADEYSQQVSELQGADPGMLLRQLNQINSLLGVMFVQTFQRLPNVANQISATMKQLSRAIKEAQQASTTASVVGKGGGPQPIRMSAAQPSTAPQGAM